MGSLGGAPLLRKPNKRAQRSHRWFSTPPITVREKFPGLTWICTMRIDDAKAGPNEPTSLISEGGR